uniref:Cell cycle associated protein 1 n=1 Tax=Ictidomys tridecemlineatus TaxID=43179 RepID=A0A287D924_ICTTR
QQNQYQASYNQSFSSQPHQVEQTELQQEQLQTGGYDGYRPSFSNTPNSGYTQSQFSAPRDYSGYQRDGYQQNFKRGSGQSGPRGAPRGNILWW